MASCLGLSPDLVSKLPSMLGEKATSDSPGTLMKRVGKTSAEPGCAEACAHEETAAPELMPLRDSTKQNDVSQTP